MWPGARGIAIAERRSAAYSLFHSFLEAREQIHGLMKYCQHTQLIILNGVEDIILERKLRVYG